MRSWILRALCALLVLLATPAHAVDMNSTIKGVVQDFEGLPVPNAQITLTSPALLGDRQTRSDADGRYRFTPLPPGDYTVSLRHPGFESFTSPALRVPIATTVRYDVTLYLEGAASEEVVVTGEAPAVDTENVATGVVLDHEFLKDIPSTRSYHQAVGLTPGVVGSGNPNVHGGFYSSNQYYIDGVNITDPMTNTFSTNMNYDAIDAVQVITGGLDAEYGRALGGAINILTKSGGNEFEGQAMVVYHKGPEMVLAPERQIYGDDFSDEMQGQVVANLGGPVLRDKLWFFLSFQGDRSRTRPSFDNDVVGRDLKRFPMLPSDWRSLYWFGKLTAQPDPAHRVWVQIQGDPTWIDNAEGDPYTLPSAETFWYQGGWLGSIGHQWTPSEKVLVETQLYHQRSTIHNYSMLWKHCQEFEDAAAWFQCKHGFEGMDYLGETVTPSWFATSEGDFASGEYPYAVFTTRFRSSLNTSLTYFADLLGEHRFKTGIQAEMLINREVWPGLAGPKHKPGSGEPYWTYNPALDPDDIGPMNLEAYEPNQLVLWDNDFDLRFGGNLVSAYLQDVYKPHRRFTLRPGLRFDYSEMRNEDDKTTAKKEKSEVVYNSLTVSPRLGAAYDLTGDGKTALHGAYGRFYDSGFLILAALLQRTSQGVEIFNWNPDLGAWAENPSVSVADTFLRAPKLRNPYSDEFNVGLTREIGRDTSLDVTFIHEVSRRFWEDDEVNLVWNHDGTQVIGGRDGTTDAQYRLRTPDNVFTRYTSMELTLLKSHKENWSLLGSYVWSRAYGTNSSDQATAGFDIPEQRPFEIGILDHDITHQVKFTGSYTEPSVVRTGRVNGGYVLGWNFQFNSGLPYRPLVFNNQYGAFSNYDSVGYGRYRLPAWAQLDLRLGLNFDYDERAEWMVGVDIFNVLNDRTITDVSTAWDPEATLEESTFGAPLDRQFPRWMQATIRGEF